MGQTKIAKGQKTILYRARFWVRLATGGFAEEVREFRAAHTNQAQKIASGIATANGWSVNNVGRV